MVYIMRSRHGGGHSSIGLELGLHIFSKLIDSNYKSKWRIGNNIHKCSLCGKCQFACPTDAITVSVHNQSWTLNNMRCRQCLACMVKCPINCLNQVSL